jgi:hypothetical protein
MKIHPLANVFAMHSKDRLAELVESIKRNGLRDPIMLDKEGQVIDGRNRLVACNLADVEPRFDTYTGDDIEEYIWDKNGIPRDNTKGARAMAFALLHPETDRREQAEREKGRLTPGNVTLPGELSKNILMQARRVIKEFGADSDIVEQIKVGASLEAAYQSALDAQREREQLEEKIANLQEQIKKLGINPIPDIAEVDEPDPQEFAQSMLQRNRQRQSMYRGVEEKSEYLSYVLGAIQPLEQLAARKVVSSDFNDDSFYAAVRSGMADAIRFAQRIAEANKADPSKSRIRKVK